MNKQVLENMLASLKYFKEMDNVLIFPSDKNRKIYPVYAKEYEFQVDISRKGHKLTKCTFQLRRGNTKLYRIDLIGREHTNPPGDYKYANQSIECPHIHTIRHQLGLSVALPVEEGLIAIPDDELSYMINGFRYFMEEVNIANRHDIKCIANENLI